MDYPGWAALVPTLAAALLIGAGASDPASGPGRLLVWRPVRFCGRISYTWYLWHVPATFFAVTLFPSLDRWPFLLAVELLAGGLAFLTTVLGRVCWVSAANTSRWLTGRPRRGR